VVKIIAEIGVNHNGKIGLARRLIDEAVAAGANAVKFQTFDPRALEPPSGRRDMLYKLRLSPQEHRDLKKQADELGLEFISTPFDIKSLAFLVNDVGVETIKIASGNLDNELLLTAAAKSGLNIILSTGMADMASICEGLTLAGPNTTLLHCTSGYPTPLNEANVQAMAVMGETCGCPVGLSDHTEGIVAPMVAASLGASVIEKHLTLDKAMKGPDHKASADPATFKAMVKAVRTVEVTLGDGVKRLMPSEVEMFKVAEVRRKWRKQ